MTDDTESAETEPAIVETLSTQHLTTRVDSEDGLPVLVLNDGEMEICIDPAIGDREVAADRFTRLAAVALAAAQQLRGAPSTPGRPRLGGDAAPLVTGDGVWWKHEGRTLPQAPSPTRR